MKDLLEKFENKRPEVVFEWKDTETEAEGWVVINSLRGGAAGGGTRMRVGLDKREVESLAKTMEVKFTVSGPAIGGAKSGINFDPTDPRKEGVLRRWYKAVTPILKHYYGTGGDLNVDETHEVIPITEDCGVWHPQEGVFNGHFQPTEAQKVNRIGQLRQGVIKVIEDPQYSPDIDKKFVVADNVGSAAAYYLAQEGAKIVGIIDRNGGLINEYGFGLNEIKELFMNKDGNQLKADQMLSFDEINAKVWDLKSEVFLPCAASRLVKQDEIERMINTGLEVVACGANVPFADPEIFFGPIADFTDERVSVIPDFISNCGMARVFGYLMSNNDVDMTDQGIFNDTSETIRMAIEKTYNQQPLKTNIAKTAFELALTQLI